jgi:hypothetical protein
MTRQKWQESLVAIVLGGTLLFSALGCNGDDDNDSEQDTETSTETGTGTGDGCTAPFAWGSGLVVDETVENWQFTGYMDSNGDGVVEPEEVTFDMEDIHCTGKQSVVFVLVDTTCPYCPDRMTELAGIEAEINAANGAILAVCTNSYSTATSTIADNYLSNFIDGSYFSGVKPATVNNLGVPFIGIVDLETGRVMLRDESLLMPITTVTAYVNWANEN